MKIKTLEIKNIGMIADETIEFERSLNLFYGEIRQGKTTILNAVKLCFGGSFPQDIIKHGESEASIKLSFNDASIQREFYRAKDATVKARSIKYIINGEEQKKPIEKIEKFLNPFLLDQDYLIKMTEAERKKYFVELFGTDTTELNKTLNDILDSAKELRSEIKGYGDIDINSVEKVDLTAIKEEKEKLVTQHDFELIGYENEQGSILDRNNLIKDTKIGIHETEELLSQLKKTLEDSPVIESKLVKPELDTSDIEKKIEGAISQNVKYEQYIKDKERISQLKIKKEQLLECERVSQEIRDEKIEKLSEISGSCNIEGLEFDESGNFVYEKTTAGMLSTSQMMDLSSELTKLYPDGFGINLIDRGESLGKSIFKYVERAQRDDLTILATIVGEKESDIPENIGVFVIEKGEIK